MNTPTPRTDAEITFTGAYTHTCGELSCDECNARTAALRAERDHWQEIAKTMSAEREHNANVAQEMTAERDQLRAVFPLICAAIGNGACCKNSVSLGFIESIPNEVQLVVAELRADCENETKWAAHYLADSLAEKARAEKAEADLAAAKERLRSEAMDDYASIKDLQRELAALTAELTVALANWNGALERAMKAEADLVALAQCHDDNCRAVVKIAAELATMKEGAK